MDQVAYYYSLLARFIPGLRQIHFPKAVRVLVYGSRCTPYHQPELA